MARPTQADIVQVDLDGFKASVDKQFEATQRQFGLANKMILGIYALLFGAALGAIGGGIAVYREIGEAKQTLETQIVATKAEVSASRRDFDTIQDRVGKIEERLTTGQGQLSTGLASINESIASLRRDLTPAIVLTPTEEDAIRSVFFLPKGPPKAPPKYKIGDVISGASSFPDEILAKAPRLKDFRYAKDPNGSVMIIGANDRVVAVVAPV
jgi:hypothetical protein